MSHVRPFGLTLSTASAQQIADLALSTRRDGADGVGLVVTPNIEHIARLRQSPALMQAYHNAVLTVCDGWPVQRYARLCGLPVDRVTGCEIAEALMGAEAYAPWQRIFLVLDSAETETAVRAWADQRGLASRVATVIPPFGFESDDRYCQEMAGQIHAHGTTLLLMAVGAPRSEIFVDRYRSLLPPCWAFCVGQAVKIALGLVERAPGFWQTAGLEWLWRVRQEPKRLARRYLVSSVGFALAVLEDRRRMSGERVRA
jgi:N-acetylglucosaminyldiphosphoundecaprenol N-acetyl-beta-D-mannosaminyltransferase